MRLRRVQQRHHAILRVPYRITNDQILDRAGVPDIEMIVRKMQLLVMSCQITESQKVVVSAHNAQELCAHFCAGRTHQSTQSNISTNTGDTGNMDMYCSGYITMGVVCEYPDTTYDLEYHLSTISYTTVVTSVLAICYTRHTG